MENKTANFSVDTPGRIDNHPKDDLAYLYLLVDATTLTFKIGVSINVNQRVKAFAGSFDLKKSFQLVCYKIEVFRIEKLLHFLFRDFNVNKSYADGYTEWFSMECFEQVRQFLQEYKSKLKWLDLEPIIYTDRQVKNPSASKSRGLGIFDLTEEKIYEHNKSICENLRQWFSTLESNQALVGRFLEIGQHYLVVNTKGKDRQIIFPKDLVAKDIVFLNRGHGFFRIFDGWTYLGNFPFSFITINFSYFNNVNYEAPLREEILRLLFSVAEVSQEKCKKLALLLLKFKKLERKFFEECINQGY